MHRVWKIYLYLQAQQPKCRQIFIAFSICIYNYIYICVYVCMYACMHACMYVCMYSIHIYIYVGILVQAGSRICILTTWAAEKGVGGTRALAHSITKSSQVMGLCSRKWNHTPELTMVLAISIPIIPIPCWWNTNFCCPGPVDPERTITTKVHDVDVPWRHLRALQSSTGHMSIRKYVILKRPH